MLDIKIGVPGQQDAIVAGGTMIQIHADFLRVIGGTYQQLKEHNPLLGRIFKDVLLKALNSPDCPAWKDGSIPGVGEVISVPVPRKGDKEGQ